MKLVTNLCIIHKNNKVLLGMKKRGFGAGRWNGFGGKVKEGESIEECLLRELEEEAGIKLEKFSKVGILEFTFAHNGEIIEVHVYKGNSFSGEPTETEEMKPAWFSIREIPFNDMWPSDTFWFPLLLKNKKFKGKFVLGEGDKVVEEEIEEVAEL